MNIFFDLDGTLTDSGVGVTRCLQHYVETGMFENELYPGVPEGLESLARDGHRIWVVTSKYTVYADRIVDHFGLPMRWGYGSADELREAEPDHLATSMREVWRIITREGKS